LDAFLSPANEKVCQRLNPGPEAARYDAGAPRALWEFRWEHAEARIAARRGNRAEAARHVAAAKTALTKMETADPQLYRQQAAFMPYLTGYIAFYSGDYTTAAADLEKDTRNDPFVQCLLGQAYEKLGERAKAMECYRKAAGTGHNPPTAFARPFARQKIA
jgi:tetratricopeptide (TPR) repeat protein